MNITIKKASIKNSLFLAFEYDQSVNATKNIIKTSSDAPIHDDLRNAYRYLIPHFAFICEEINESQCEELIENPDKEINEDSAIYGYRVSGFSISGSGDTEGVVLSGSKKLKTGMVVNFNTPFIKFDSDYDFMDDFLSRIENLRSEVYEYLEGKQAPSKQAEMKFDDDDESAI